MPAQPNAEPFVGLAYIDGLAIVVVERVNAALDGADASPLCIQGSEERLDFAADCCDIQGLSFRFSTRSGLAGQRRSGRLDAGY